MKNGVLHIIFVFLLCIFVLRWILSNFFKEDLNDTYGIYAEGEDIVMEAVDRNMEYEQQAAGGEERNERQVIYDSENWEERYDKMYEDQADEGENEENVYDKMYV